MSASISAAGAASLPQGSPQPAGGNGLGSGSAGTTPPEAAQIRYVSPVVRLDPEAGLAVLRVRDTSSGDVKMQIPAERVVREYRSTQTSEPIAERGPSQEVSRRPAADQGARIEVNPQSAQ